MPAADLAGPTRRDPTLLWIVVAVLLAARISISIYETFHPPRRPALIPWEEPAGAPALACLLEGSIRAERTANVYSPDAQRLGEAHPAISPS